MKEGERLREQGGEGGKAEGKKGRGGKEAAEQVRGEMIRDSRWNREGREGDRRRESRGEERK